MNEGGAAVWGVCQSATTRPAQAAPRHGPGHGMNPQGRVHDLELDDFHRLDHGGRGDVRHAVRLGVEGDDIDDPHDLDVVRDELRCGADILQAATVAPHVNQLLVHAGNTPTDLR